MSHNGEQKLIVIAVSSCTRILSEKHKMQNKRPNLATLFILYLATQIKGRGTEPSLPRKTLELFSPDFHFWAWPCSRCNHRSRLCSFCRCSLCRARLIQLETSRPSRTCSSQSSLNTRRKWGCDSISSCFFFQSLFVQYDVGPKLSYKLWPLKVNQEIFKKNHISQDLKSSLSSSETRLEALENELNGRLNMLERALADQAAMITVNRNTFSGKRTNNRREAGTSIQIFQSHQISAHFILKLHIFPKILMWSKASISCNNWPDSQV